MKKNEKWLANDSNSYGNTTKKEYEMNIEGIKIKVFDFNIKEFFKKTE